MILEHVLLDACRNVLPILWGGASESGRTEVMTVWLNLEGVLPGKCDGYFSIQ